MTFIIDGRHVSGHVGSEVARFARDLPRILSLQSELAIPRCLRAIAGHPFPTLKSYEPTPLTILVRFGDP